ncbi:MAG: SdpI family protein [Muricoprocola sp.]
MLKRNKKYIIITSLIMLLPILVGLLLWNKLPEQVPTHFDSSGVPNDYSSKAFAVFGINFILIACHLLVAFATAADPKRQRIQDKVYRLMLWICPILSIFVGVMVYGYCLNFKINISFAGGLLIGFIFIIVGNYLPKCKQNYMIGIKLPWTLDDMDNWNATHRMAGPVWVLGGLAILILNIAGLHNTWTFLGITLLVALIPCIYSFLFYIRHN